MPANEKIRIFIDIKNTPFFSYLRKELEAQLALEISKITNSTAELEKPLSEIFKITNSTAELEKPLPQILIYDQSRNGFLKSGNQYEWLATINLHDRQHTVDNLANYILNDLGLAYALLGTVLENAANVQHHEVNDLSSDDDQDSLVDDSLDYPQPHDTPDTTPQGINCVEVLEKTEHYIRAKINGDGIELIGITNYPKVLVKGEPIQPTPEVRGMLLALLQTPNQVIHETEMRQRLEVFCERNRTYVSDSAWTGTLYSLSVLLKAKGAQFYIQMIKKDQDIWFRLAPVNPNTQRQSRIVRL